MAQQNEDEGENCVYQVNMQAFPLSFLKAPEQT